MKIPKGTKFEWGCLDLVVQDQSIYLLRFPLLHESICPSSSMDRRIMFWHSNNAFQMCQISIILSILLFFFSEEFHQNQTSKCLQASRCHCKNKFTL